MEVNKIKKKKKNKSKLLTGEGKLAPDSRGAGGFQLFDNERLKVPSLCPRGQILTQLWKKRGVYVIWAVGES